MSSISALDRENAIQWARGLLAAPTFVIVDSETTGVSKTDEIVSIGVVDGSGALLLDRLVKPIRAIPPDAIRIHGISNIDVDKAPRFPEIYPDVAALLNRRVVVGYNVDYDLGLLHTACKRHKLPPIQPLVAHCAMKAYAKFYGQYNPATGDYAWQRLSVACQRFGIETRNAHSAIGDCLLTLELIRHMAAA